MIIISFTKVNYKDGVTPIEAKNLNEIQDEILNHTGDKNNPHGISAQQIDAAPAGYGLGEVKYIKASALNTTAAKNGWYAIAGDGITLGGHYQGDWFIHTTRYNSDNIVQDMYPLNAGRYKLVRRCHNGTWYEEWENPPFLEGVEYLTTDRIGGKAVYKKKDSSGAILYRLDGEDTWNKYNVLMGAAPGGFGFGGAMTYVDMTADAYQGMTFDQALDSVQANMPGRSAAQIQFVEPTGAEITSKCIGYLWNYTGNYASLMSINYNGNKRIKYKHRPNPNDPGVWYPWEWENPPMQPGVEYRTTERHGGKVVYRKRITYTNAETIGKASGVSTTLVPHNISNFGECVRVTARQTGSVLPYITTSGGLAVVATVTAASVILSFKDCTWTSREWDFDIAYTKND